MRIKEIEINNFKAIFSREIISLGNSGKNLMIFGENGSGKSSICQAIELVFSASLKDVNISEFSNVFNAKNPNNSYVKLTFRDTSTRRDRPFRLDSSNQRISEQFIVEANKRKAFLDYRQVIKTHLIDTDKVDLFHILVEDILQHAINPVTTKTFKSEWDEIFNFKIDRRRQSEYENFKKQIDDYSSGLKQLLSEVEKEANEIIKEFNYSLKIKLKHRKLTITDENEISGNNIFLDIDFFDKSDLPNHHLFLNEARLTAIAISIFLGSILIIPDSGQYKILVLDDIFIGLDTSNRIPFIEILRKKFSDYQIFMATYDRQWYELVKKFVNTNKWHFIEMYIKEEHQNGYEIPIIHDKTSFIDRAEYHLNNGDFKASAVYLRSEFERLLKALCDKTGKPVKYKIQSHKVNIDSFWQAVQNEKIPRTNTQLFTNKMRTDLTRYRSLILNPFSHYDLTRHQFRSELTASVQLIKDIRKRLKDKVGVT